VRNEAAIKNKIVHLWLYKGSSSGFSPVYVSCGVVHIFLARKYCSAVPKRDQILTAAIAHAIHKSKYIAIAHSNTLRIDDQIITQATYSNLLLPCSNAPYTILYHVTK
jgi:hypothetical protein